MTGYRLYLLNPSGHIVDAIEFFSESDEEAGQLAEAHAGDQPAELWSGARVVRPYVGRPAENP